MTPLRRLFIGAIVLLMAAGGYVIGRSLFRPIDRVSQPIVFSHLKHAGELGIECVTCHEYVNIAEHAGLPMLSTCMGCHEAPQTDKAEEQKVRDLVASGKNDVFRKLFRMPDHAFYSHRRHVGLGNLPCETCHGAIAKTASPPERPLVRVTMTFCLDCHHQRNVPSDCTRCHR